MIVSLPTPDGPLMMTSRAPGAPSRTCGSVTRPLPAGDGPPMPRPPAAPRAPTRARPGSGASARTSFARARRDELQLPRVEEQPLEAVRAPARGARAVDRVAGDRMPERGEVDADLVGPAGDEVELQERPAGEPLADAVAGDRSAARSGRRPSACGPSGRGRSAPRSARRAAATEPCASARYVLRTRRALSWAMTPAWAASLRATMSSPDVSRSRRWTIPGRATPAMPP